jgi:hypothetical protein
LMAEQISAAKEKILTLCLKALLLLAKKDFNHNICCVDGGILLIQIIGVSSFYFLKSSVVWVGMAM